MVDMQNSKIFPLDDHDWFTVGETEFDDADEDGNNKDIDLDDVSDKDESTDSGYSITVKVGLDTNEAEKMIRDMRKNFHKELSDMFGIPYRPLQLRFFW